MARAPHSTNASVRAAVTPNTTRSVCGLWVVCGLPGRSAMSGEAARPLPGGWSSWDTWVTFRVGRIPCRYPVSQVAHVTVG
ncbi:hypothetical protein GCM10018987_08250 [Streptomyces cremeus]